MMRHYYVPGTVPGASQMLSLILSIALPRKYYWSHFGEVSTALGEFRDSPKATY